MTLGRWLVNFKNQNGYWPTHLWISQETYDAALSESKLERPLEGQQLLCWGIPIDER